MELVAHYYVVLHLGHTRILDVNSMLNIVFNLVIENLGSGFAHSIDATPVVLNNLVFDDLAI